MKITDIFPELNDKQLDRFSELLANFSLVIVASLVLPNILGSVDKRNVNELLSGIVLAILFIGASIVLLRKDHD